MAEAKKKTGVAKKSATTHSAAKKKGSTAKKASTTAKKSAAKKTAGKAHSSSKHTTTHKTTHTTAKHTHKTAATKQPEGLAGLLGDDFAKKLSHNAEDLLKDKAEGIGEKLRDEAVEGIEKLVGMLGHKDKK